MLEDDTNIELRSSEFQDVLEAIPLWICRWGITILAIIIIVFTIGSAVYKYPDILTTNFVLTTTNPSTDIMAMSSGKIKEIYIENEQDVTFNEYLAVIENSATTKDIPSIDCEVTFFIPSTLQISSSIFLVTVCSTLLGAAPG